MEEQTPILQGILSALQAMQATNLQRLQLKQFQINVVQVDV